ncbi:putative Helitron helicase-like domain at N-terminus [Monocercomonoides exilis]|uniref:putative Helitron helicase-like domain at N-terminus n=1 Tax=Monocercomonoides exilis TaxID=2049356 RepID=UPI00355A42D3|nr:putative Helitron helicase-like domain at N-terminus [Monocercomonoides exilis]
MKTLHYHTHQQQMFGGYCNQLNDALNSNDLDVDTHSSSPSSPSSSSSVNQKMLLGRRIILPSSFVGSPRLSKQCYMDAMSIVSKYGKPDIFMTFTCNPKWSEIIENIASPHIYQADRPDLIARVFKLKLDELMRDIKKGIPFGTLKAYVYKIEFQKRGLPHCHLLLTLNDQNELRTSEDIDKCICAEIPPLSEDGSNNNLREIVLRHMVHGPCGLDKPNAQ